ncbi:MAG: hypothetical protein IKS01_04925, partial [Paludibacteraceae bacterium]|nr:hypothetical protein [Paludibacteraceae bacterium]
LGGDLLLDVTSLQTGFHTLNVMKGERQNAALQSFLFYRSDTRDSENVNVSHTYWFNQDYAHRVEGVGGGDLIIDVTQLKDGFHTLNVMAGKGRSASLQSFLFYKIPSYTSENFNLNYFCWFDENIDSTQHGVISQGPLLLDVSALKDGFHTVNIQLGTGSTNMLKSALFYKMPLVDSTDMALTYICWFDEDYSNSTTGDIGNGNLLFDISSLDEGFHTVNLQFGKGRAAMLQSYLFYKVIEVDSANMAMTYVCWFDEDYASRTSGNLGNGALLFDVSSLQDGFHNINMQFVSGHTTTVRNWIFYKAPDYGVINDSTELTWYYRIDGQECPPIVVTSTNRLIHLDLNVDNIMPGLHSISYYMTAPNGKVSELNTAYFYRTGTGIVRYEYWINGQDSAKTIVNTQPTDTLRLITMLQLDPQPIRTTCFQFDPNEGTPVIYAKNDITFRFWTGDSRFTDRKSYYIDEYVKVTVVADTLTPHVISQRTFTEPVANQIRWYKINAQIGDSLAVKASRASMLQLFSPSGEEVYTATDLKSIEYGGCNVFEDGYYYLAVHDVAPSNDSLTIYYQHIGKFAVLAHTPDHIGNLADSYFDMELFGNGMLQLDSVWLTQGGTFLAADTIVASNKSKATAVFHIQDSIPNGMYAAHFMFHDSISNETIVISNAIQFEEVDWGEILVSYSMPSRMAKPYPVVVTLENTGNMDLTYVPFNMAVDNINSINRITLENSIITMSPSADSSDYSTMVATQNLLGRQIDGGMIFSLIPIIRAKEKMRFVLSFDAPAHTMFNFWAWTDSSYEQTSHFLSDTLLYKAYFFNYKERSGIKATTAEQDAQNSQRYRNTLRATGLASGAASVLPRPARDAGRGLAVGRTFFQVGGAIGGAVQGLQNAQLDAHEENLRSS